MQVGDRVRIKRSSTHPWASERAAITGFSADNMYAYIVRLVHHDTGSVLKQDLEPLSAESRACPFRTGDTVRIKGHHVWAGHVAKFLRVSESNDEFGWFQLPDGRKGNQYLEDLELVGYMPTGNKRVLLLIP